MDIEKKYQINLKNTETFSFLSFEYGIFGWEIAVAEDS